MAERGFEISRLPGFATVAIAAFVLLYLPIATLVIFSFNASNSVAVWGGVSLKWYRAAWADREIKEAAFRSLWLAATAATISTCAATLAAIATTRTRPFRGLTTVYAIIKSVAIDH